MIIMGEDQKEYEIYRSKMLHPVIWWIHYRIVLYRREKRRKELYEEFGDNIGKIKKIKLWK